MMNEPLRHVVISGASAGLGMALALAYAASGVTLGLTGRNEQRLTATAERCRQLGATVVCGCFDTADDGDALAQWLEAFDRSYPIDLLIANAGIAHTLADRSAWEDLALTRAVIDTNVHGTLNTVLPVLAGMRQRQRGQVAVVSSLAAFRGMAISPAYCASKSAIKAWADSVRPLLASANIGMTVIYPGFIKTAMSDVFPGSKPFLWTAERAAALIKRRLAARAPEIMFPRLLAEGIRWLALLPPAAADWILDRLALSPPSRR